MPASAEDPDWWARHAGHLTWRAHVGWLLHLYKSAALQEHRGWLKTLRPHVSPAGVVIDIGAHGGQTAAAFAKLVPKGEVLAFEPSSYTYSVLKRSLSLRRLRHATPVRLALSDRPGEMTLHTPVKPNGQVGYGLASLAPTGKFATYLADSVPVTTLDAYLEAHPRGAIDLIKIDVEGAEHRVLAGAARTIDTHRPALIVEIIDAASETGTAVWQAMTARGYEGRRLTPDGSLEPVGAGPASGDIFFTPR